MNTQVTSYIEQSAENQQEVLIQLRKLILSSAPKINEQFKWSRPVYAIEKDFCYLKTTKKHVTLGFFEFEKIITNKHLVAGTGKSMRHVKLNHVKDIEEFKISQMIVELLK